MPLPTSAFTTDTQRSDDAADAFLLPALPPDKILRIIERFEQVDSFDSRERRGTGLGLTISRDLVALHGG